MKRVLITGGSGCLGTHLLRSIPSDFYVHATRRNSPCIHTKTHVLDLAENSQVADLFSEVKPEIVIHTAYGTADLEHDTTLATRNIVDASRAADAKLIHMSSDLIFDGKEYQYDEQSTPSPIMPYGEAKADLESYIHRTLPAASIIRTSLILSKDPINPSSKWIIDALTAETEITLFTDELRCPIAAPDLAVMIWKLAHLPNDESTGIWNMAGPEVLSRYTLGLLMADAWNLNPKLITPATLASHPTPRPAKLVLQSEKAINALGYTQQTVATYLNS